MSISDKFSNFCVALRMSDSTVSNVRYRAKQITKRVNYDFRGLNSDTRYSLFVGSYGRGTDIHVSDVDMIVELPYSEYEKYNNYNKKICAEYITLKQLGIEMPVELCQMYRK